jgi:hypothetical protein
MGQLATGEPVWDLTYDASGHLTSPDQGGFVAEVAASGVTDLFLFSHGWGTAQNQAEALYATMFPLIRTAAQGVPGLGKLGFGGIYWPSLWFPPTPATPPAQSDATQADDTATGPLSAGTAAVTGAQIAASLAPGFGPQDQATLTQVGQLIDAGQAMTAQGAPDDVKTQHLQQISQLIKSLVPTLDDSADSPAEDSGELALLLTDNPAADYQQAAAVFGSIQAGDSTEGIGDWFSAAVNGAKDALRVFSYYTMKARAGTIGQSGLGPLLAALNAQSPGTQSSGTRAPATRVHLIGHSFGARLVSFALSGVGASADSPVTSLSLLQGAFSHWSFSGADGNPFGAPGALHGFDDRVHGPLTATFTSFDWAVGVWYPKSSFLAGQSLSAEAADPWGGLGADAFQPAGTTVTVTMPAGGGLSYGFTPGTFYRVDANAVINDTAGEPFAGAHSDIKKLPVAQAIVAAAATHA